MLQSSVNELYIIEAIDILPKNIPPTKIAKALKRNQKETGGLEPCSLLILTYRTDLLMAK